MQVEKTRIKDVKKRAAILVDDLEDALSSDQYSKYDVFEARRELKALRKQYIFLTGSARGFPIEVLPEGKR